VTVGLAAQRPVDILAGLRALRFGPPSGASDTAPGELETRHQAEALQRGIRQGWQHFDNLSLAQASIDLWYVLARSGSTQAALEAVLDDLEAWLRQRPDSRDGWSLLLRQRSRIAKDTGRTSDLAARWQELWQAFSGPKRYWIAVEAARALITVLDQPAMAVELLTRAIGELERQPEWGEPARAALARDMDLYLTLPERDRAATWREARGQMHLLRGYAREQIGHLLPAVGDLMAARADFVWSDNRHRLVNCDHNLAVVWLHLGKLDLAMRIAEDAERRYREPIRLLPWEPVTTDGNGWRAMQKIRAQALVRRGGPGDLERAEELFVEMVTADFLASLGETNVDALLSYADLVLRLPSTAAREQTLDGLVARLRRFCGDNHEQLLFVRVELMVAQRDLQRGDLRAARHRLELVEAPLRRHHHALVQVQRLLVLARVEQADGDAAAALHACVTASALVQQGLVREQLWRLEGVSEAYLSQFGGILAVAKAACDGVGDGGVPRHTTFLQQLHLVVQRFHGAIALCRIQTAGEARSPLRSGDQQDRLRQLQGDVDRLSGRHGWLLRQPPRHPFARRQRDLDLVRVQAELDHAEAALAAFTVAHELGTGALAVPAYSAADLQAALRPGELLVECVEVSGDAWAFASTRDGIELHPLPHGTDWSAAIAAVRSWASARDATLDAGAVPSLGQMAAELLPPGGWFDRLLQRPDIDTLLWSPEASFGGVPIAALPWQGKPLVVSKAIAHIVSGSVLVQMRRDMVPAATSPRLLALGNPRYPVVALQRLIERSQVEGGGFVPLPGSAAEVLAIAGLFASEEERQQLEAVADPLAFDGELSGQRFRVLLGDAARESALTLAALREVQVLHIACHGEANPEVPGMSFLALTLSPGDPDQGDDGLLRLSELCRLRGAFELVVLSACTSAVGAADAHDGVGGLAWAAQVAGAQRVLATLWRLPDLVARDLAVSFHGRWLAARGSAAMDLATVQRAAIGKLPVCDWASLVLWGEPR
jgi:CHAT domain-containing protein